MMTVQIGHYFCSENYRGAFSVGYTIELQRLCDERLFPFVWSQR